MTIRTQSEQHYLTAKSQLSDMFNGKSLIPLKDICDAFLNISVTTAQRKARLNELPFPAFRLGLSQKSPWLVSLDDLAVFIDKQTSTARKEWKRVQI